MLNPSNSKHNTAKQSQAHTDAPLAALGGRLAFIESEYSPPTLTGGETPVSIAKGFYVALPTHLDVTAWSVFDGEDFNADFNSRQLYETASGADTIARWIGGSVVRNFHPEQE